MNIERQQIRAAFEQAAAVSLQWNEALERLAIGYFVLLNNTQEEENPVTIHEEVAAAMALANFGERMQWYGEDARDGLFRNAQAAKRAALRKVAGKVVAFNVTIPGPAQAHTTH